MRIEVYPIIKCVYVEPDNVRKPIFDLRQGSLSEVALKPEASTVITMEFPFRRLQGKNGKWYVIHAQTSRETSAEVSVRRENDVSSKINKNYYDVDYRWRRAAEELPYPAI